VGYPPAPSIPERYGSTVLLCVGVALIGASIAAVFTGHQLVAGGLASMGLLVCVASNLIDRMEGAFSLLGFRGCLRPTRVRIGIVDTLPLEHTASAHREPDCTPADAPRIAATKPAAERH